MHDRAGYADFYDRQLALMRNPWQQRRFADDLRAIAARLPAGFTALDLGCGTGNLTLKLLALGVRVVGVDSSQAMLYRLAAKAGPDAPLELICGDADEFLAGCDRRFNMVCACSFYHHLPDYLATIGAAADRVAPGGAFYLVHEPADRRGVDAVTRWLEWLDFRWQRFEARTQIGGRVGRHDPYYDPASLADYWELAGGLDQHAIARLLAARGLSVRVRRYDSKRHRLLHVLAELLGTCHLLRILATRPPSRP